MDFFIHLSPCLFWVVGIHVSVSQIVVIRRLEPAFCIFYLYEQVLNKKLSKHSLNLAIPNVKGLCGSKRKSKNKNRGGVFLEHHNHMSAMNTEIL